LRAAAPERIDEVTFIREILRTRNLARIRTLGSQVRAQLGEATSVLPALVAMYDRDEHGSSLVQRILAYAPTPAEINAHHAFASGASAMHMAVAPDDDFGSFYDHIEIARGLHALLRLGGNPLATDALGRLPQAWCKSQTTPMYEVLATAVNDVRARRRALAMALHPRLGRNSPLRILGLDILRTYIATAENCLPPQPKPGKLVERTDRIKEILETEESIRFERVELRVDMPRGFYFALMPENDVERCAREERALLTPGWRQHFRLLWVIMHNQRLARKLLKTTTRSTREDDASEDDDLEVSFEVHDKKVLATLKRVFLADGRLPPLSHWQ
jgi:hypothetical protein